MTSKSKYFKFFEEGYKPKDLVRMGFPRSSVYTAWKRWKEVPRDRRKYVKIEVGVVDGSTTYRFTIFLRTTLPIFKVIDDLNHIKEMWEEGVPLT